MAVSEIVETHEEAAGQDLAPLLVRKPLEDYFDSQGLGEGPILAERIGEGHSNVTFLITRGDDRSSSPSRTTTCARRRSSPPATTSPCWECRST
jgi:hypothetical protein